MTDLLTARRLLRALKRGKILRVKNPDNNLVFNLVHKRVGYRTHTYSAQGWSKYARRRGENAYVFDCRSDGDMLMWLMRLEFIGYVNVDGKAIVSP